jgi:WD40 repeat protein
VIVLWDIASGSRLGAIVPGGQGVERVAFSPNGRTLASGDSTGSVVVWDVDEVSWAGLACARANRNLYPLEWRRYFGSEPYHPTCPDLPSGDRRIATTASAPARISQDST